MSDTLSALRRKEQQLQQVFIRVHRRMEDALEKDWASVYANNRMEKDAIDYHIRRINEAIQTIELLQEGFYDHFT